MRGRTLTLTQERVEFEIKALSRFTLQVSNPQQHSEYELIPPTRGQNQSVGKLQLTCKPTETQVTQCFYQPHNCSQNPRSISVTAQNNL